MMPIALLALVSGGGKYLGSDAEPPAPERMQDLIRSLSECGRKLSGYAEEALNAQNPA